MAARVCILGKTTNLHKVIVFRGRDHVRFHKKSLGVISNHRLLGENGYSFINRTLFRI